MAIEHPKDADLAAGIVLAEVIPFVSKKLPLATPPSDNAHGAPLNVEGGVAPPQDNAHGAPLNVQGGVASFVLSFLFLYHCTLFALVWFTNVSFVTCLKCS